MQQGGDLFSCLVISYQYDKWQLVECVFTGPIPPPLHMQQTVDKRDGHSLKQCTADAVAFVRRPLVGNVYCNKVF